MNNMGSARAYTNIALIKYWGKKDNSLIIPMNNSLSLTLDAFYTDTTVKFTSSLNEDQFFLNGQRQTSKEEKKIHQFLNFIRQSFGVNEYAKIESKNHVPTGAGLASSASGFAALAGACSEALHLNLSLKELSRLARRGSGSACRSIYGGFSEWEKGTKDENSFALPLFADNWEKELAMLFIVVNDQIKEVSSRSGMQKTVETSCFYPGWLETVDKDLKQAKHAIKEKDFQLLGKTIEANSLKMHATTLGAHPPFTYWSEESMKAMKSIRQARKQGIPCYFTMDAGPNVKVLVEKKNLKILHDFLINFFSENQLISALAGPGICILKERRQNDK